MKLAVVILAAGQGKRMKSSLPKMLQPLAGRPMLSHVIETARSLEPASIHVVYGHGGDRVREALQDQPVSWVLQKEQLGTGHAVMQALPHVKDEDLALILAGDVPLIRRQTLIDFTQLADPQTMALLTVMLADPTGYGRVLRDAGGQVRRIVEEKDASKAERKVRECNSGIMAIPGKHLRNWLGRVKNDNAQGEYYLTDVVALAVKDGIAIKPFVAPGAEEVLGVNDKAQLADVEAIRRRSVTRELMLAGLTVADPARLDVRGTFTFGTDCFVDVNVVLEGVVRIGDRVRIGPNCVIRDSEIGDDTELFPNCVLDSARIGARCNIGPFARFRPTSTLANEVHIGNFVEVKNSSMADGSKANHLTYVGDAQIGSRVNLGAGTIVANYDGANKHRTIVEDDVHTGSNSVLVAPITIGAGATVGAGSTVTKHVPPGKLTVARAKQVTLDGWQRPKKSKKS